MLTLPGEEMCPIRRDVTMAITVYPQKDESVMTHHCVKELPHTLHAAGCLIVARLTHNRCPFSFVCVLFGAEPFDGLVANVVLLSGGLGRRGR